MAFSTAGARTLLFILGTMWPATDLHAFDLLSPRPVSGQRVVVDSSLDTGHGGGSFDLTTTFAPSGVGTSGFRARLTGSVSWYDFVADPNAKLLASGLAEEADVLVGYAIVAPRISFLGLVGAAFVHGVDAGVVTDRRGTKAVLSMYAQPTDDTMAYASYQYLTISNFFQFQAKVGAKLPFGGLYFGPEVKLTGVGAVNQVRVGAHLSGAALGPFYLSLSAGQSNDEQLGSGQYVSLSLYAGF